MSKAATRAEPKEQPIIFTGPMVRAILDGRKTQTRRLRGLKEINREPDVWYFCELNGYGNAVFTKDGRAYKEIKNPYGGEGDRLWVRETWGTDFNARFHEEHGLSAPDFIVDAGGEPCVLYAADKNFPMLINEEFAAEHNHFAWKSPYHMRRAASRITLELTDVSVERVQDITGNDAREEGVCEPGDTAPRSGLYRIGQFRDGWDRMHKARGFGWDVNPFVWVLSFRRLD